jgi:predicted phosphodiesterase
MPASTAEDLWQKELNGIEADFVLLGHTHEPFKRRIGDKWVVNPGSLGQPKGNGPMASYAVWEDGAISHKVVPYDYQHTIRRIDQAPLDLQIQQRLKHILAFGTLP